MKENLLPAVNLFCYGQVQSTFGLQFMGTLLSIEDEKLVRAQINQDQDIYDAIKLYLGKGA